MIGGEGATAEANVVVSKLLRKQSCRQQQKQQQQTRPGTWTWAERRGQQGHLDAGVRVEVEVKAKGERDAAVDARARPHVALSVVAGVVCGEEARAVALENSDVGDRRRVATLQL